MLQLGLSVPWYHDSEYQIGEGKLNKSVESKTGAMEKPDKRNLDAVES